MASIFGRFFGNLVSNAGGQAIGGAVRPTLDPLTQKLANETWQLYPDVPPDPYALANGVAQGQVDEGAARAWAAESGFGESQFTALVAIANVGPAFGNLLDGYRRGLLDDAAFNRGLRRLAIEPEWWPMLRSLRRFLLSPAEAANARQQGYLSQAEQYAIATEHGLTTGDAETQFLTVGLPPGAATAQEYLNRGLIDDATFAEMIREGHTKTKYTDVLRRGAAYVLSPIQYVEARIRDWITDAEMYAGTAKHGVTREDTDLLFKTHGRPISTHQTFIGLRRGGALDGPTADIHPAFLAALRRSNIQPPFYNLAWAGRYNYPSAFVLRGLAQAGDLTQQETETILLYEGWEPTLAAKVTARWAGGGGAVSDPHVGKAQTQLWTTLHRSYIAEESAADVATATLGTLGVDAAAQQQILALWDAERALIRKQLTPAQLRKAVKAAVVNPATGAAWTLQEALDRMLDLGYDEADARTFLAE